MFFGRSKHRKLLAYLEEEKKTYPEIFENSPDIFLFVIDLKGTIVNIRGGESLLDGIEPAEIIGKKFKDFIFEEDKEKVNGYFKEVFSGITKYVEYRTLGFNGEVLYVDNTLVPIVIENNEVIGLYGLARNISVTKELEFGIQETSCKLESLFHHSHEVISILDEEGRVSFHSSSIERLFGYTPGEIIGINYLDFVHHEDQGIAERKFNEILLRPKIPYTVELRLKHKNGEFHDYEVIYSNQLDNPGVNGIVCNFHNITQLKKMQREIQYMANHDLLTGLPNRRYFNERLELEVRLANSEERKFAVLFLNLDGFKFLNDSKGHAIGDLLLIEIARKLKNKLTNKIELIARIGGDEFAILTTKVQDTFFVEQIAKEVLEVFDHPFEIKEYQLYLTSSLGVSIYPDSGEDASSLMTNTNLALHLAEKSGNNTFQIYSPTANIGTYKVFSLRNDLKHALYNNQFQLYYQPIYHTGTNQIESVEALIRWDHPDWGIVSPNEFIHHAEESGVIHELGKWVLQTVCTNLRIWHEAGFFVKASVNLSLVQFLRKGLVEMIQSTLRENEIDPKWLTIEITESTMIEQEVRVLDKVRRIREMGIEISLDDFGTGYASFKKIKDLKPDILKLDKSLIDGIESDIESTEITTAIIRLAHRLSIRVVAEGVETKEQHAFLEKLDCDWVQGYLFSRPVPAKDIQRLLHGERISEQNPMPQTERRKFFRIDFQYPLEANMTISEWKGKKVSLGNTKILIENIGPGGLRFLSKIKLPSNTDCVLRFQLKVLEETLDIYGKIIHDSEQGDIYRYGVQLIVDEPTREYLIKHFNQFQLLLKKNPILPNHTFITKEIQAYFNKL
ncbi:EAL domain-containing protein [Sporosarcina ureilytica]|uniref:Diguanylate cyclase n=1 Tax=Sporosarcina ureilytica TaxID=298596 RepID=A0A1D8JFN8_9BACL|nr:EAL domain-containing protein [Sporosarcina ureilytica]AOV07522.1 hypothetical protein BI350_08235 [Sporosarcina ureilytica]